VEEQGIIDHVNDIVWMSDERSREQNHQYLQVTKCSTHECSYLTSVEQDPHGQVNFAKQSVPGNFLTVATSLLTLHIILTPFS